MKRWHSVVQKATEEVQARSLLKMVQDENDDENKIDVVEYDEDDEQDVLFGDLTPRGGKGDDLDQYLIGLSKKFMKYRLNVFLLNRVRVLKFLIVQGALRIQHWFFETRHSRRQLRKVVSPPIVQSGLRKPTLIQPSKIPRVQTTSQVEKTQNCMILETASPFSRKESKGQLNTCVTQASSEKESSEKKQSTFETEPQPKQVLKKSASLAHHQKLDTTKQIVRSIIVPRLSLASSGRASVRQSSNTHNQSLIQHTTSAVSSRKLETQRPASSKVFQPPTSGKDLQKKIPVPKNAVFESTIGNQLMSTAAAGTGSYTDRGTRNNFLGSGYNTQQSLGNE